MSEGLDLDSADMAGRLGAVADEFTQRLNRGEQPDAEEYVRRYPELADVLRQVLETVQLLRVPASPPADKAPPEGLLGDFRIVREVGRGGMGVVYEAVQLSLGRRVALKVLPLAATLDPRQLQRFKNEAQAAAQLHHTNIVPVFAVGSERGLHYYAMQFIDGHTLADLVAQLRSRAALGQEDPGSGGEDRPTPPPDPRPALRDPRTAARLGVQAAEALEHAHQMGVIHRDIKPSNLLVDARGNLWVTDFGLAHCQGDASLTLTGDLVGTVRYMSPEQALAKRVPIDQRTDVYSLGATLYELLTLQPVCPGTDRQQILQQITQQEPRSPRRLNGSIPAELETIVLKALAKEPAERYTTAQELADDLRRFLDDKPIQARRPTLWQHARKWLWRHRAAVTAAVSSALAGLAAAVVVLAVSYAHIAGQNQQLEEKTRQLEAEQGRTLTALEGEKAARGALEVEERATQEALGQEREALYGYRIALAHREWRANHVGRAEFLLGECPDSLRRWEWHYLKRLCHADLRTLPCGGDVDAVAFSPDGKLVAAAGVGRDLFLRVRGEVRVWDAGSGGEVLRRQAPGQYVYTIAFSPAGKFLAGGCEDHRVRVWRVPGGEEALTLAGHTAVVLGVAFSPDGNRLASGSNDKTVKVWAAATGALLLDLKAHTTHLHSVAFSPDGKWLIVGDDTTVDVWDAQAGAEVCRCSGHTGRVRGVAVSGDGQVLASASEDGTVKLWRLGGTPGGLLATLDGQAGPVQGVAFHPDGKRLASAHQHQVVKVWDLSTRQEVNALRGHTARVTGVAFAPDGARLASSSDDGTVKLWQALAPQEALGLPGNGRAIAALGFTPAGKGLSLVSATWDTRLCDVASGQDLRAPTRPTPRNGLFTGAISPDGLRVAAACWFTSRQTWEVKVWDTRSAGEVCRLASSNVVRHCLEFSPDGVLLAGGGTDGTVRLWDPSTGEQRLLLRGLSRPIRALAFGRGGALLAAVDEASAVRVWAMPAGEELLALQGPWGAVLALAFSPDGRHLALGGVDRRVEVRSTADGSRVLSLGGHAAAIRGLAYHPEGRLLAAAVADGSVILWDTRTGRETLTLRGDAVDAAVVTFSPDGTRLACGGADGVARVFDGTPWPEQPEARPPGGDLPAEPPPVTPQDKDSDK
jgi:eukaryotic-like serine/threonine-protein kinase